MKKIPTMFKRDWNGDRSRVTTQVHAGCEWVLAGEGIATRKIDGTCCMVRGGKLFKRREIKKDTVAPPEFEYVDHDNETGKTVGWVPVGDGPEDAYHREAFCGQLDGTYELVGPKIQGNPEKFAAHTLIPHTIERLAFNRPDDPPEPPRDFEGIREWFAEKDIEGVVFHHPDGRMAKIKGRDFGHKRPKP